MRRGKRLLISTLFLFLPSISAAMTQISLKPSYFFFSNSPLKHIYKKGAFEIQASLAAPISTYLHLYGSMGYRHAHGHALNTGQGTTLFVIPIDFGLQSIMPMYKRFRYFFGIGPRFFYFRQHNTSPYVSAHIQGGGVGFFIHSGVNIITTNRFLVGIFGEYSYEKDSIISKTSQVYSDGRVQLGGAAFGITIGYLF